MSLVIEQPITVLDLAYPDLVAWLRERGEPAFRAQQIFRALYRDLVTDYDQITTLPKALRARLATELPLVAPAVARALHSRDERTVKLLLALAGGAQIETVLMLYPPNPESPKARATVCVSTQAGCAYGCTFCATGQMGFTRHLRPGEIVAQVLHFARLLRGEPWRWPTVPGTAGAPDGGILDHITNIVLMGMGEPLHNYDNTLRALRLLNAPEGFNLGARHMTVSTVGLVPAIQRLAGEGLQVNLAISLHAPNNEMRAQTMPVARKWHMDELLATCLDFARRTGRQVTFEYVLLADVNDQIAHAAELGQRLAPFGPLAHVNLIPVNVTAAGYRPPGGATIRAFRDTLRQAGVSNSVRAERGDDIAAACGQLRTLAQKEKGLKGLSHR
jgi:23S rRNA (adenine2503-C2)-methyltransferase